jgi:hypothetical protein
MEANMKRISILLLILLTCVVSAAWAQPIPLTKHTIITFDVPGAQATEPSSINSAGVITGRSVDVNRVSHGFLRAPSGSFTGFDVPGAGTGQSQGTYPQGINSAGVITGFYVDADGVHGFVRAADGSFSEFDAAVAVRTYPEAINDAGVTAGYYNDAANVGHGFLRAADGTLTEFDAPGAGTGSFLGTFAYGINSAGAITGFYSDANSIGHGFLRNPDGTITEFDAPYGAYTFAQGINSAGAITGLVGIGNGEGFLRAPDGSFTEFYAPGVVGSTIPLCINDGGTIAGSVTNKRPASRGFVRAPNGKITKFQVSGAGTRAYQGTFPRDMNQAGVITGYYIDAVSAGHGFLRQ